MKEEDYALARWLAGEMSEDELAEFRNSNEYREYERIARVSSQFTAPGFDADAMLGKVTAGPKQKVIRLIDRAWLRAAAIIVVLLAVGLMIKFMLPQTESAAIAEQHSFSLPDASQVVLNSGSTATFSTWNWDEDRRIELEGEAYFKVAKGRKFTVGTNLGSVSVLGTQFNVSARGARFEVACFEGRVRVDYQGKSSVLTAGQTLAFASGNEVPAPPLARTPDWIRGELAFSNESLTHILSELNLQYDRKINLEGPPTTQLFTGTLPLNDLDQALAILASAYHLEKKESGDQITLSPANDPR